MRQRKPIKKPVLVYSATTNGTARVGKQLGGSEMNAAFKKEADEWQKIISAPVDPAAVRTLPVGAVTANFGKASNELKNALAELTTAGIQYLQNDRKNN